MAWPTKDGDFTDLQRHWLIQTCTGTCACHTEMDSHKLGLHRWPRAPSPLVITIFETQRLWNPHCCSAGVHSSLLLVVVLSTGDARFDSVSGDLTTSSVPAFSSFTQPKPIPGDREGATRVVSVVAEVDVVVVAFQREMPDPRNPGETYTTTWFDMWRFIDGKADEHWDYGLINAPPAANGKAKGKQVEPATFRSLQISAACVRFLVACKGTLGISI